MSSEDDEMPGSSGSLLPGTKAKLLDREEKEITQENVPGQLLVHTPSAASGYLVCSRNKGPKFPIEIDENGEAWVRTGDYAMVRTSKKGNQHFFILERVEDLIDVGVSCASNPSS